MAYTRPDFYSVSEYFWLLDAGDGSPWLDRSVIPVRHQPVITALLGVLGWTAITLTALAWFGEARQQIQGRQLACRFQAELKRRGLFSASVIRT